MKLLKLAVAALFALSYSSAYAFHSGGVAECGGCHSMHSAVSTDSNLLVAVDQSSTCLSCHMNTADTQPSSYHVATYSANMTTSGGGYPIQRSPGGDFSWLLITKTAINREGGIDTFGGYKNGHNIIAAAPGFTVDPANATAPGGTFASTSLTCVSCHDQHGQARRISGDVIVSGSSSTGLPIANSGSYNTSADPTTNTAVGIYRLLRTSTAGPGIPFPGAPVAVAPRTYNKNETDNANQVRVAGSGIPAGTGNTTWGQWCGACHPRMLSSDAGTDHRHPVDVDLGSFAGNYNRYVKSGWTNNTIVTAFTSLVPFAKGSTITNYAALKTLATVATNLNGPDSSDQVTCLSCHRAHASAFPEMTRFGLENEFVTNGAGAYVNVLSRDNTGMIASYNGRTENNLLPGPSVGVIYAQRVLCNKCHNKD
jgi:predicted CXXCH cytochrome family protein